MGFFQQPDKARVERPSRIKGRPRKVSSRPLRVSGRGAGARQRRDVLGCHSSWGTADIQRAGGRGAGDLRRAGLARLNGGSAPAGSTGFPARAEPAPERTPLPRGLCSSRLSLLPLQRCDKCHLDRVLGGRLAAMQATSYGNLSLERANLYLEQNVHLSGRGNY